MQVACCRCTSKQHKHNNSNNSSNSDNQRIFEFFFYNFYFKQCLLCYQAAQARHRWLCARREGVGGWWCCWGSERRSGVASEYSIRPLATSEVVLSVVTVLARSFVRSFVGCCCHVDVCVWAYRDMLLFSILVIRVHRYELIATYGCLCLCVCMCMCSGFHATRTFSIYLFACLLFDRVYSSCCFALLIDFYLQHLLWLKIVACKHKKEIIWIQAFRVLNWK